MFSNCSGGGSAAVIPLIAGQRRIADHVNHLVCSPFASFFSAFVSPTFDWRPAAFGESFFREKERESLVDGVPMATCL